MTATELERGHPLLSHGKLLGLRTLQGNEPCRQNPFLLSVSSK